MSQRSSTGRASACFHSSRCHHAPHLKVLCHRHWLGVQQCIWYCLSFLSPEKLPQLNIPGCVNNRLDSGPPPRPHALHYLQRAPIGHVCTQCQYNPRRRLWHWTTMCCVCYSRQTPDMRKDYMSGDCQLVGGCTLFGRRPLRSAERCVCHVPRQNSTYGDRSFAAAGPRTWNELPFSLRDTGLSLTTFNEHLKTYYSPSRFETTTHL